jgi:hypothetical protein
MSFAANAMTRDELHFSIGQSVSIHPYASQNSTATMFENKLSKDGTFVKNSPTIDFHTMEIKGLKYSKFSLVYSRDCVNSPVVGAAYSAGAYYSSHTYVGWALGGYLMDEKPWNDKGITKSWISIGDNRAIVPLLGLEFNVRIFKFGKIEANWQNYVNPFLINTTVAVGFSF